MSFNEQVFNDLEPLIIRGKNAHSKLKHQRDGNTISKKKQPNEAAIKMAKLDNDTESTKVERVSKKVSQLIRDKRNAKKMTQKQLANQAQISQVDLQKYENGTAIPKTPILIKLGKILGVRLTNIDKK